MSLDVQSNQTLGEEEFAPPGEADLAVRKRRRRLPLSCNECRRRKTKCDRNMPCSHCVQSKNANCTYDPQAVPRSRPSKEARATLTSSSAPESITSGTSIPDNSSFSIGTTAYSSNSNQRRPTLSADQQSLIPWDSPSPSVDESDPSQQTVQGLSYRVHKPPVSFVESSDVNKSSSIKLKWKPASQKRGSMSKTLVSGQSHWMNLLEQFNIIRTVTMNVEFERESELGRTLEQCKQMRKSEKASQLWQAPLAPDFNALMLSHAVSTELCRHYFRTFESSHRILHEPSFWKEFSQYWNSPSASNPMFTTILLLVMAIGSVFYQNAADEASIRAMSKQWIGATQAWLYGPFEKGRLNLAGLQAHCLVILACQTCMVSSEWVLFSEGFLVRLATQMGFHRDPKFFPKLSILEAELRRRLWATILELDVQSSLDSGMPSLISFDDFDCEPPANINDEEIDENTNVLPKAKPLSAHTQTSIQLLLLHSLRTRLDIVKLLNNFRSDPTYEQALALSAEITSYLKNSTSFVESTRPRLSALHRNLLDLHNRRFLLTLHLPFAIRARTDPHYYFSRKIILDTCMHVLGYSGIDNPELSTPESFGSKDDDFTRLKLLAGGFFRGVMIHATVALGLEFITQTEEESYWAASSLIPREALHAALDDAVQLAKRRINLGETNVKCYLLIAMIHGQIQAMEKRENVEKAIIATATKTATELCHCLEANSIQNGPQAGNGEVGDISGGALNDAQWDMVMQDLVTNTNWDVPDSWLFSNWENVY